VSSTSTPSRTPEPVLGPLARTAARVPLRPPLERSHRLLLTLIAAFADAGEQSPPVSELARRLGLNGPRQVAVGKVDKRLKDLERAGLLDVRWKASQHEHPRNVYELRLGGGA
jgi:hypothetical protein